MKFMSATTLLLFQILAYAQVAPAQESRKTTTHEPEKKPSLSYDRYGGISELSSRAGAGNNFRVEMYGKHWVLVTPEGHIMWMRGIFDAAVDTHVDALGSSHQQRVLAKYGDLTNWALFTNKRLKAWGFNTLAEYSMAYNIKSSEKLPWILFVRPAHYALLPNQYASSPTKDLMASAGPNYKGYRGATVPDVFDPSFASWIKGSLSGGAPKDPWLLGIAIDDSDSLYGFGPGPEVNTGHTSVHIGWLSLVVDPEQTSNARLRVGSYSDKKVYTKFALADFLQRKYSNIQALNRAWGSHYTSFGSEGGWGKGTGLLDEDGGSPWVGSDFALVGTQSRLRPDLDEFLYEYAKQYFSIVAAAARHYAPDKLLMGPATLNGWGGLTRPQVLRAAGEYLDIVQASINTQFILDRTAESIGNKPLITWEGETANLDSGMWRTQRGFQTQMQRGEWYSNRILQDFRGTVTGSGIQPVIGEKFWALTDSWAEKANWGLVSLLDNAYDGNEAVRAASKDVYGFTRGGEEKDYGDFISTVKNTHLQIDQELTSMKAH